MINIGIDIKAKIAIVFAYYNLAHRVISKDDIDERYLDDLIWDIRSDIGDAIPDYSTIYNNLQWGEWKN
jgi:hypothetical protein